MKNFLALLFLANVTNAVLGQQQALLYNIIVERSGFASFDDKHFIFLDVYLNNNSNDTLYYRGANCDNLLFSVKANPCFHIDTDICHQNKYLKATVPPQRSKRMRVYLTMDKTPNRDISISLKMDLYKLTAELKEQSEALFSNSLSDSTVLHYNSNYQPYWAKNEAENVAIKEQSILPDMDIYLLTDNDRKIYTLTVEKTKIGVARDTIIDTFDKKKPKKAKVFTVRAIFHNDADDTLKFYSMTCSWFDFWSTNHKNIGISDWDCLKNIPEIVTVAPHKEYERDLDITYYSDIKSGTQFRLSMSLLKVPDDPRWSWAISLTDYIRFNKIWTDEIAIP